MMKDRVSGFLAILLIVSLLASLFAVHVKMRELTSGYPDEYRSYYIPSSAQVKAFSLGYNNAAADLIYIWFLQFYDWYNKSVRYEYMKHTFEVMTDLDPRHQEAYIIAALFAFIPLKYDYVYDFLDKGIEKNPDNYVLPYEAGCYAFFSEKNYDRAAKYFKIAQERSPDKGIIRSLYAKALAKRGELEVALEYFQDLYARYEKNDSTEGNYYRGAAARYIWNTKVSIAERDVAAAVSEYRVRRGKNPASLAELVREGLLPAIPRDPAGNEYKYERTDGKITCVTNFDPKKAIGRW